MQKYVEIKKFIQGFKFESPNWENLPPNFPNIPKKGLSREEKHLLDAIKTAWYLNERGRSLLYKKTLLISILAFISFISLISLISLANQGTLPKPVNAATVKIDKVIQSTMSAVRRTK